MTRNATIALPAEFLDKCNEDGVTPEAVLQGFIADLCDIESDASHDSNVRFLVQAYYALAGYARR